METKSYRAKVILEVEIGPVLENWKEKRFKEWVQSQRSGSVRITEVSLEPNWQEIVHDSDH